MPGEPIVDPQVVGFCNGFLRTLADKVANKHMAAKQAVFEELAKGIMALIPDDDTPIADGAPADGRGAITGADVHAFVNMMAGEVVDYEANDNAKAILVQRIAVNYTRI